MVGRADQASSTSIPAMGLSSASAGASALVSRVGWRTPQRRRWTAHSVKELHLQKQTPRHSDRGRFRQAAERSPTAKCHSSLSGSASSRESRQHAQQLVETPLAQAIGSVRLSAVNWARDLGGPTHMAPCLKLVSQAGVRPCIFCLPVPISQPRARGWHWQPE